MKNKKIKNFSIIVIILLLIITISLSAAYLYAGLTLEDQNLGAEFEELNSLIFTKTGDLALDVTQLNAAEGEDNISGEVTLSATYTGENVSKEKYNVYVNVLENDFVYTTDEEYAEVILRVYNTEDIEIIELEGLTYVNQNGNSGFDITTYTGLITIANFFEIELTDGINEVVQNWKFEIEFVNLDTKQNANSGKTLIAEVTTSVDEVTGSVDLCDGENPFDKGTFQYNIINNGGCVNSDEPDFEVIATTNEGIFKTVDVYGPTYYFRGAVEDNWVKFAGFYWRIIRINGDGSVKLIYSGENAPVEEWKIVKIGDTQLSSTTKFNLENNLAEYVGYTYSSRSLNNPTIKGSGDSTIKGAVESWYETNIENQGFSSYIEDTAHCADRTSYADSSGTLVNSDYNTPAHYFPFFVDLYTNKTPTLLCNDKQDYYTAEDTEIGNAELKYPVSLITANEVAYAGGVFGLENSNYYLYTGSHYWMISPFYFPGINACVGVMHANGTLDYTSANSSYGARPVLSLNSEVLTTGDGSWSSPYEVK